MSSRPSRATAHDETRPLEPRVRELVILADLVSARTRDAVLAEIKRHGLTAEMFSDRTLGDAFAMCLADAATPFGITDGSVASLTDNDRKSLPRLVRPAKAAEDVRAVVQHHAKEHMRHALMEADLAAAQRTDAADYLAEIAEAVRRIQATEEDAGDAKSDTAHPTGTVADIRAKTRDRVDYSNEIFRDLWLERGGGAFWISSSGTGKSVHSIQAAYAWALGRPYFGITPRREIRVAIVQAEDSVNECTVTFNGVRAGYKSVAGGGWTDADLASAEARIDFWGDLCGRRGDVFCAALRARLQDARLAGSPVDLIIINPFTSFIEGDINKSEDVIEFLQNGLDPVIKARETACAALLFHHTNKPPSADRGARGGWATVAEKAEYAGSGSSAITNWARATLLFLRNETCNGDIFDFIANKRGGLLGWKKADGKQTQYLRIRHTRYGEIIANERTPFWQLATDDDMARSMAEKKERGDAAVAERKERTAKERADQAEDDLTKAADVADAIVRSGIVYTAGQVKSKLADAVCLTVGAARVKTMFYAIRDAPKKYGMLHWRNGSMDLYGATDAVMKLRDGTETGRA